MYHHGREEGHTWYQKMKIERGFWLLRNGSREITCLMSKEVGSYLWLLVILELPRRSHSDEGGHWLVMRRNLLKQLVRSFLLFGHLCGLKFVNCIFFWLLVCLWIPCLIFITNSGWYKYANMIWRFSTCFFTPAINTFFCCRNREMFIFVGIDCGSIS